MLAEVVGWEPGAVEPCREERAGWPGEVVALAIGHRAGRLTDQDDARILQDRGTNRIGVCQILGHLAGATGQDVVNHGREAVRLTLVRTHTYAQRRFAMAPRPAGQ